MAKRRSERHVRQVKHTLATRAAKPAAERVLARGPDPKGGAPSSAGAAMAGYRPSGAPGSWGGSSTPDATGQVGAPGNLNVFGYLTGEDYNPDLDGFAMFANYNKMRLSDAQVNATLLMLKLPLKGATWIVKPASDDPQDVAIADFVQANLIDEDALARSWQHVLDNAMLKFDFGCAGAEIVWDVTVGADSELTRVAQVVELARGGDVEALAAAETIDGPAYSKVTDLAPRLPRTFYRWVMDPATNRLKYLQQFGPKNGQYGYWNIDADRLALHVRAREGDNFYGRSVLRTAYPHWWWKQQLYRIDMIGHDRFHVGIPRAKLGPTYSANIAPLEKIEATLKGLRSHDRAYMVEPDGVTYDVFGQHSTAGTGASGIIQSVEHHNLMIARNILQSFSAQGEQRHGSFGAAKVTSDVYFDALEGEANEIGSELTHAVVRRLCDANFDMRGRQYPSVHCTDISAVDFSQLATAMAALAEKGLITPEDDLEAWLRDLADAPGLPDALKGRPRGKPTPAAPAGPGAPAPVSQPGAPKTRTPKNKGNDRPDTIAASKRASYEEAGRVFGRAPTDLERRVFDLHAVPSRLDAEREHLVTKMADIRRAQLTTVARRLANKDARSSTKPFTDMRHTEIAMPKVADMERAIRETQRAVLAYGRDQVRHELQRQGVKLTRDLAAKTPATNEQTATSALVTSAKVTAQKQADSWQARIMEAGIRLRRTGLQRGDLEQRIIDELADEADSGARRDAAAEVHEAFGIGRAQEAQDQRESIGSAVYSAILDANTCDPCAELDGEEFDLDSPEYDENLPPNANCEGGDNCRCVMIFVAKDDTA
jgi:SPP1 gp7 family putative phage head morphogenesis protein